MIVGTIAKSCSKPLILLNWAGVPIPEAHQAPLDRSNEERVVAHSFLPAVRGIVVPEQVVVCVGADQLFLLWRLRRRRLEPVPHCREPASRREQRFVRRAAAGCLVHDGLL